MCATATAGSGVSTTGPVIMRTGRAQSGFTGMVPGMGIITGMGMAAVIIMGTVTAAVIMAAAGNMGMDMVTAGGIGVITNEPLRPGGHRRRGLSPNPANPANPVLMTPAL